MIRLLSILSLAACTGGDADDGDRDRRQHDDSGGDDSGGDDSGDPGTEGACDDGVDGTDGDGLVDCADDECAGAFRCTWPESIAHRTLGEFKGETIECAWGIEYDVPDCLTDLSSTLTVATDADQCTGCDLTFYGTYTVTRDTCQELTGEAPPPDIRVGFDFVNETKRDLWARDDTGTWAKAGSLTTTDGVTWTIGGSEEVWEDPEDCDNGDQFLGTVTVTMTFTDQ